MDRPSSVWEGNDSSLLSWMIPFYWRSGEPRAPRILDATWGLGRFWPVSCDLRGLGYVTGMDLDVRGRPDVQADNMAMPFIDRSFDVVVYDPPHMTDVGNQEVAERYGHGGRRADNMADYAPFLREACRVLREDGIVLAKIADQVHGGKAQWQHVVFMLDSHEVGLTTCDLIIKIRTAGRTDPKWKNVYHAKKRHSYFIVLRKGAC